MTKTTKTKIPCRYCGSLNTAKHGMNRAGTPIIGCNDCRKQLAIPKPPLSTINCSCCGKLGINYRKPNLCKNCYFQNKRDRYAIKQILTDLILKDTDLLLKVKDINREEFADYLYVITRKKSNLILDNKTINQYLSDYLKIVNNIKCVIDQYKEAQKKTFNSGSILQ